MLKTKIKAKRSETPRLKTSPKQSFKEGLSQRNKMKVYDDDGELSKKSKGRVMERMLPKRKSFSG